MSIIEAQKSEIAQHPGWYWRISHHHLQGRHANLLDPHGRVRATVWDNATWFLWDEHGVGGENDVERRGFYSALKRVEEAMDREGWTNPKLKPAPPDPLNEFELAELEERLDPHGSPGGKLFLNRVLSVAHAYEQFINGEL